MLSDPFDYLDDNTDNDDGDIENSANDLAIDG